MTFNNSNDIKFNFNADKTVQVAAMFLKLHPGRKMKYLGLLKLIYMADRLALQRIDWPLTGDRYVAMKYGPVLSTVYDLIKRETRYGEKIDSSLKIWEKYISKAKRFFEIDEKCEVHLLTDPGSSELSEEEEEIIEEVYKNCGNYDCFKLAELTHDFPEWQDPNQLNPPRKVSSINNIDLLRHLGKTQEEIEKIKDIAIREAFLDSIENDVNN